MLASQDTMDRRQNTFEIYGADFMLSEDYKPWLIEINCSPDLSFSTKVTSRMCSQCMEDVIKGTNRSLSYNQKLQVHFSVVVDRRRDPSANTGLFEMVYKQNFPRTPPYLGMNLSVRGRKIFRSRSKVKSDKDRDKDKVSIKMRKTELLSAELSKPVLPNLVTTSSYRGPVIEDFIQELHKYTTEKDGIEFVPTTKPHDKLKTAGCKPDRVAKKSSSKYKTNKNHSFCRKQNAKENSRKEASLNNNYIDLFSDWSLKSKIPCDYSKRPCEDLWEKETASILKGTNILKSCSNSPVEGDPNKSYFQPHCLTTFDLNKLIPQLNSNNCN